MHLAIKNLSINWVSLFYLPYKHISILSISYFIFLLNISVLFSFCARLNRQFVCQFLSANSPLYCIVLVLTSFSDM